MHFFVSFLVFLIILFLYIHIIHQLKTSEDLEIYEMDYGTNSQLQEVCEVKQPVLFEFQSIYPDIYENLSKEEIFSKYGSYDVKIKDTRDYNQSTESVDYVVLSLQSSQNLVDSDSGSHYFSENNEEVNPFIFNVNISNRFYLDQIFSRSYDSITRLEKYLTRDQKEILEYNLNRKKRLS